MKGADPEAAGRGLLHQEESQAHPGPHSRRTRNHNFLLCTSPSGLLEAEALSVSLCCLSPCLKKETQRQRDERQRDGGEKKDRDRGC